MSDIEQVIERLAKFADSMERQYNMPQEVSDLRALLAEIADLKEKLRVENASHRSTIKSYEGLRLSSHNRWERGGT